MRAVSDGRAYAQGDHRRGDRCRQDTQDAVVPGATIIATHEPSGTTYEAVSQADGRFSLPGMRVGGTA